MTERVSMARPAVFLRGVAYGIIARRVPVVTYVAFPNLHSSKFHSLREPIGRIWLSSKLCIIRNTRSADCELPPVE